MCKRWVGLFPLIGILCMVLAGCVDLNRYLVLEPFQLPIPTGPYPVGTCSRLMTDASRCETFDKKAPLSPRKIMVRFWYPAERTATGKTADYMDEKSAMHYSAEFKIDPDKGIEMMKLIQTHAVNDAPVMDRRFPILIFSPGLNSNVCAYQAMLEETASHGYIVAAVDHPFISGITVFSDGQAVVMDPSMEKLEGMKTNFRIVLDDLKFLISRLNMLNASAESPFRNRMDLSKIGAFGHSYGGAASVRLAMEEPACKAAINLDGWLEGDGYDRPLTTPILFMAGQTYTDSVDPNWNTAWKSLEAGCRVRIQGSTHLNFGDLGMIGHHFFPGIPTRYFRVDLGDVVYWRLGEIDPGLAVVITNDYTRKFFDFTLKGVSPEPLRALTAKYAVVEFEMK